LLSHPEEPEGVAEASRKVEAGLEDSAGVDPEEAHFWVW